MKNVDYRWDKLAAALIATRETWRKLQWDYNVPL